MDHVMIDLETLSTESNALILTIGAIKFSLNDLEGKIGDTFYRRIDLSSYYNMTNNSLLDHIIHKSQTIQSEINTSSNHHFDINSNTLSWWSSQSIQARSEAFYGDDRVNIKDALLSFIQWLDKTIYVWSHGSCFDIPILENALKIFNYKVPWKFWNIRDTRTIYHLARIMPVDSDIPPNLTSHHALGDCYKQTHAVIKAKKILSLNYNSNFEIYIKENKKRCCLI